MLKYIYIPIICLIVGLIIGIIIGLIEGLIVGLFFFIIILICAYPVISLALQPKETVYVTVKRIKRTIDFVGERLSSLAGDVSAENAKTPNLLVTFEFPNGTEKEFELHYHIKHNITEINTSGILTYRERKNAKSYKDREFINFENARKYD